MQNQAHDLGVLAVTLNPDWTLTVSISGLLLVIVVLIVVGFVLWRLVAKGVSAEMEIDQAEIGAGSGKLTFKPNWTDRQIAYSVWVELSTRKIGLPIDFEHDVIAEIFDSWYAFFGITRELIKTVPVQKVRTRSTQKIIKLSIDVLNEALRPTLTKWQARYRRWYEYALENEPAAAAPQLIQQRFPEWAELKADIEHVNLRLMAYRARLKSLVMTE